MKVKDLRPNAKNPRKISDAKLENLKKSLAKFGDLSGFVYNRRSKTLVSGHQRQKSLPADAKIHIEVKHDVPTKAMTVAEGYVLIEGERFKYREVDADPTWEMEALLAANKHSGEWDKDLLKLAIADLPDLDLNLAGFDSLELKAMDIEIPKLEAPAFSSPFVGPASGGDPDDSDHYEDEEEESEGSDEDADKKYLEENPGPDSMLEKERIPSTVNAFDAIEEKTDIVGKRFVIIIDCPDEKTKQELREKLRSQVTEAGAKFF